MVVVYKEHQVLVRTMVGLTVGLRLDPNGRVVKSAKYTAIRSDPLHAGSNPLLGTSSDPYAMNMLRNPSWGARTRIPRLWANRDFLQV